VVLTFGQTSRNGLIELATFEEFSSMVLYATGALFVFGLSLHTFLKDASTPKTDRLSWIIMIIATVFWPLVLPSIVRKKLLKPAVVPLQTQIS
jgi:hypothetical protein